MITLGIETSCDETAVALVDRGRVLSSEVSSSVHLHAGFGGVVPEIASRHHVEYISAVFLKVLEISGKKRAEIELVAVTQGPGLPGSLLVGISFAKAISLAEDIPIMGVNHLQAHILSCFLDERFELRTTGVFPFVGVVVSGGHTSIFVCRSLSDFTVIGRTKDDAVGEAFDKVAKILGLGYPGGPIVEERSGVFDGENEIDFPRALLKDRSDLDFSFSGIKTAVLYHWRNSEKTDREKNRVCRSFQRSVIDVLETKIDRALDATGVKTLAVGGGVVNNNTLRERLLSMSRRKNVRIHLPPKELCTDNAAMTALLGEALFEQEEAADLFLNAKPGGY